jgi:hypothetical protein
VTIATLFCSRPTMVAPQAHSGADRPSAFCTF